MAKIHYAHVNKHGEIVLPHHLAKELGLAAGMIFELSQTVMACTCTHPSQLSSGYMSKQPINAILTAVPACETSGM
jgi:hypothetical protein